jgi:hypothetical protein
VKPNPGFDDEIRLKGSRWWWPVRSIGRLMLVVAASALTMAIIAGTVGHKITPKQRTSRARVPVMNPPALPIASQLPDPFVIVADATIDPKMVVPAPPIDEAMVFNPESRDRLPALAPGPESTPARDGLPRRFSMPHPR